MKWIKMLKSYPGTKNIIIPGLERCIYEQGRDYQVSEDIAGKLIKTRYAELTTAPWERGVNRPMLEIETRKADIEKLQAELVKKETTLQNARQIALTIPVAEKAVNKVKKELESKLKALEDFAAKNNIFLTKEAKEAAEQAAAQAAAKEAAKQEAENKAKSKGKTNKDKSDGTNDQPPTGEPGSEKPEDDGNTGEQTNDDGKKELSN
ncbi:MAG: hypothetical protein A2Y12_06145 [Planctomycetes bacterium GWF2_42_9]|nr:MAG: hypothetical protein A2Y12_06145 [Planctomycetes bacterium GWF2_42_9]HAL45688.1 hypothetical protein [Phycisphaerales bacterium]